MSCFFALCFYPISCTLVVLLVSEVSPRLQYVWENSFSLWHHCSARITPCGSLFVVSDTLVVCIWSLDTCSELPNSYLPLLQSTGPCFFFFLLRKAGALPCNIRRENPNICTKAKTRQKRSKKMRKRTAQSDRVL